MGVPLLRPGKMRLSKGANQLLEAGFVAQPIPLTPALSLRERGKPGPVLEHFRSTGLADRLTTIHTLLGERTGVRGNRTLEMQQVVKNGFAPLSDIRSHQESHSGAHLLPAVFRGSAFHPGFRAIHPNCMAFGLHVSHSGVVTPSLTQGSRENYLRGSGVPGRGCRGARGGGRVSREPSANPRLPPLAPRTSTLALEPSMSDCL